MPLLNIWTFVMLSIIVNIGNRPELIDRFWLLLIGCKTVWIFAWRSSWLIAKKLWCIAKNFDILPKCFDWLPDNQSPKCSRFNPGLTYDSPHQSGAVQMKGFQRASTGAGRCWGPARFLYELSDQLLIFDITWK